MAIRFRAAPSGVFMHSRVMRAMLSALMVALPAVIGAQAEKIDLPTLAKIRDEGLNRSQVMDHMIWLSDIYGPRLTGSPTFEQAGQWAIKTLTGWGLSNPH